MERSRVRGSRDGSSQGKGWDVETRVSGASPTIAHRPEVGSGTAAVGEGTAGLPEQNAPEHRGGASVGAGWAGGFAAEPANVSASVSSSRPRTVTESALETACPRQPASADVGASATRAVSVRSITAQGRVDRFGFASGIIDT
ncbi:hypothetical protein VT85_01285 [Planctomyces sp. SH-PL62]|nr:hypothetical protein VT85_01285 [Planctomyces sp. SH-PL62]